MAIERQFTMPVLQELFTNHELLYREAYRPKGARADEVKSVGILGGGTAGWLTALALRVHLPWLKVSVIETPAIPVIGVGEATIPSLLAFLHHFLGLDVNEFTRAVRPTWKQGIRFEWGLPGDYVFQAPFDWEVNGIGMLGSLAEKNNVSYYTLQSHLMARGTTPIIKTGNKLQSYLPILAFAYHVDNGRMIAYLTKKGIEAGVNHVVRRIADAVIRPVDGDPDPHVSHLVSEDGEEIACDFYIDCSGFPSFLLGNKLGDEFHSYAASLYTDRAYAFNAPHGGNPMPYTTARTMNNGWCWTVPMIADNHHGYVFSSAHCSEDEAIEEVRKLHPDMTNARMLRFKSGRHERVWIGNVYAIGNAYAFVEPLESSGLMMIQRAINALVRAFPISPDSQVMRRFINGTIGRDWDRLRWFLASHFKFNRRLDTPFWQENREKVDVSGIQEALDVYETCGPLSLLPRAMRQSLNDQLGFLFFGLHGFDAILLGQKVPHKEIAREPKAVWSKRQKIASEFARRGLPYAKALVEIEKNPQWLAQVVEHPAGWVAKMAQFI